MSRFPIGVIIDSFRTDIPTAVKKAAGVASAAHKPGKEKAGVITREQIREIVQIKKEDINARSEEAAMRIIEGTARSMGIEVVDA